MSILNDVKKGVGLDSDYKVFDDKIIMDINTAFYVLWQLGVGKDPSHPFKIVDDKADWTDFIDDGLMEVCKSDIILRVQLLFDPPQNSFLIQNINDQIKEYEWRMTVGVDEYKT